MIGLLLSPGLSFLISNVGVWSGGLCPARPRCPPISPPTPCLCPSPPTAMVELDGDDVRISSRGKLAERDIVQVKPRPCLPHRKCKSPSRQADLTPPSRGFSGKGPWKEALGALEWLGHTEGNRSQS